MQFEHVSSHVPPCRFVFARKLARCPRVFLRTSFHFESSLAAGMGMLWGRLLRMSHVNGMLLTAVSSLSLGWGCILIFIMTPATWQVDVQKQDLVAEFQQEALAVWALQKWVAQINCFVSLIDSLLTTHEAYLEKLMVRGSWWVMPSERPRRYHLGCGTPYSLSWSVVLFILTWSGLSKPTNYKAIFAIAWWVCIGKANLGGSSATSPKAHRCRQVWVPLQLKESVNSCFHAEYHFESCWGLPTGNLFRCRCKPHFGGLQLRMSLVLSMSQGG